MFMMSSGGLTAAELFQGKDAILSGPAAGVVGMAESGREAGFSHLIGFDMGGTSTDVSHFDGEYERAFETEVAGVRMRAPMMLIHTVAAGGGSLLHFDGARFRVGPDSAGANPGPKCYRRGGPLAVTDANVMVGKLIPDFFPRIFGAQQDLPLDAEAVREAFAQLAHEIGDGRSAEDTADGFIRIAVENMANAIKKISLQRGYDVTRYALNCFGGAGGQHACLVADALGMTKVLIHPFSSLLSAYGMGLADIRATRQQALEEPFGDAVLASIATVGGRLGDDARNEVIGQGVAPEAVTVHARAHIRYAGTDMALVVPAYSTGFIHADGRAAPASPPPLAGEGQGGGGHDDSGDHAPSAPLPRKRGREQAASDGETAMHAGVLNSGLSLAKMKSAFEAAHKSRFGFIDETKDLVVEAVSVEAIGGGTKFAEPVLPITGDPLPSPTRRTRFYSARPMARRHGLYARPSFRPATPWPGRPSSSSRIRPSWSRTAGAPASPPRTTWCSSAPLASSARARSAPTPTRSCSKCSITSSCRSPSRWACRCRTPPTPSTSRSGSISPARCSTPTARWSPTRRTCRCISAPWIARSRPSFARTRAGSRRATSMPSTRPTTAARICPTSPSARRCSTRPAASILFWVASRGHHADVGGISPGSMSPNATTIEEEGIYIDNFKLVDRGRFRERALYDLLTGAKYPARNPLQNVNDMKAQIAANEKGVQELRKMVAHFTLPVVRAYMQHVQDNAAESVRRVIDRIHDASFAYEMDQGTWIKVKISVDKEKREATVDFTGTSPQQNTNFNAPEPVTRAAVLYVFRVMVDDDIPMNAGCLRPINIIIPKQSMLSPEYPAAVVAGNVETSQAVTDCLFGALGASPPRRAR